jgi:hypothetical protein
VSLRDRVSLALLAAALPLIAAGAALLGRVGRGLLAAGGYCFAVAILLSVDDVKGEGRT